ncbi:MAG: ATP-binding cassette subfamily C protein [Paracoccaceae bacterium]
MIVLRFITLCLRSDPRRSTFALALLIVSAGAETMGLLVLGALVDRAGLDGAEALTAGPFAWAARVLGWAPGLGGVLALLVAALLLRAAIAFAYGGVAARISANLLHRLRMRLYDAVAAAKWTAVSGLRRNELHHALSMAPMRLAMGADMALRFAMALVTVAVAGLLALSVDPGLVGMVALIALVIAVPMIWFDRRIARGSRHVFRDTQRLFDHVARYLDNLKLDRFQSARGTGVSQFAHASAAQAEMSRNVEMISQRSALVRQAGGALGLGAVIWAGAARGMSPAEAALIVVLFLRLLPRLFSAHALLQELIGAGAAFDEYDAQVRGYANAAEPRSPARAAQGAAEIVAQGVTFRWPGADQPALRGVSLRLAPGQATGLIGLSGAGKTTLADLLCGLSSPESGRVLVDGQVLTPDALHGWRGQVALVSRDDFLIPDTLRANLLMGAEAGDDALWRALDIVGFADQIRARGGLDTPIGDRGDGLSAGQRQRLCLARGIVQRPRLLVLDEATSAMNPVDEAAIAGRLADLRGDATILIIAHRLSSIAWVDQVAALEAGRLVEAGPRDSLTGDGFLARMAAAGGG